MKQLRECFTIDGYINKIGIDFQLESCAQILLLRAGITCYTTLVFSTIRIIGHNNQRDQPHVLHGLMKNLLRWIQILL
jgi:hypothetical protein